MASMVKGYFFHFSFEGNPQAIDILWKQEDALTPIGNDGEEVAATLLL